jgi:hypothetical protein
MTTKIEQVVYGCVNAQESLSLLSRFEPAHAALSYPRWLMRKFRTVIGILRCVMNRIGNEFTVGDPVATQLVCHYLPWFITMCPQQSFEKVLSSLAIPTSLEKHIDHLTVLIDCTPEIVLLTMDLHKYYINEKCISITLMSTP